MMMLYRKVKLKAGAPVQYVGVYVLHWKKNWGEPEAGFVEPEGTDHICPFCGEGEFDLIGLKYHFEAGHCQPYNSIGCNR